MSVFKYIFKTPIATIRKDFKDYELLRREEAVASYVRRMTYESLHVRYGLYSEDVTSSDRKGCIVTSFRSYPDFGRDSDPAVSPCLSLCRDFNYSLSCTVQDCPYHNFNRAYFDAVQEYNEVRQKRKNFWKQKFSNAK